MAETLTSSVKMSIAGALASSIDIGNRGYNVNYSKSYSLANGTAANQANQIFSDTRTITASGSEDLDLSGSLANAFGTTIAFTKIKAIIISAAAGNTNNVIVGGNDTAAWAAMFGADTDTLVLRPGATFCMCVPDSTGLAVTATTDDLLTIANSGGTTSVTYEIVIIGVV